MPPEVEALARKYLRKPVVVQVGRRSAAASTVAHAVYPVPRDKKSALLVELLRKPEMDSVLVFTRTKHGADRVVRHLERAGITATAMHADKTQAQRTQALEGFKRGTIRVLVATDIAQRGLDITGHHARHQLRRAAAARGLRAPHRPHGPRRGDGRRVHVHVARRDRDGAHDRARDRPADSADFGSGVRLRDGGGRLIARVVRGGLRRAGAAPAFFISSTHRRTRPSRDTKIVSAAVPRRRTIVRFDAP